MVIENNQEPTRITELNPDGIFHDFLDLLRLWINSAPSPPLGNRTPPFPFHIVGVLASCC